MVLFIKELSRLRWRLVTGCLLFRSLGIFICKNTCQMQLILRELLPPNHISHSPITPTFLIITTY